ncbi:MAG: methionyl-tRNA formyltransferase [Deltaproteobacteria bacterium]|nr:methionyl-tRNA formyltransferase [Deltaproteobacteria bacterium]
MSSSWPIVYMGTPEVAAVTLETLLPGPDPIVGVVTQPDRPTGRGQKTIPSPVRRMAESYGVPVVAPEKIRDTNLLETLKRWNPRIIVVVAYGRILPKSILELAPHGCLNVHYSLLPKYRGAAPAAWTIINGEEKAGVTTMQLIEKMDAGPIYLQEEVTLDSNETTASLQVKLTPIGTQLLLETIRRLKEGHLEPRTQDEAGVTFAPMIQKKDGLLDWTQPALAIERRVRGFTPWPTAYTQLRGKLLKIHRATSIETTRQGGPGEVVRADSGGFWIATGDGTLALEEVQLENKKRLPGVDFIRGARIEHGERF